MKNQFFKIVISAVVSFFILGSAIANPSHQNNTSAFAIDVREIINDIITTVGLKQNFSIMESQAIPNAAAVIYDGKRFIAYNPRFVTQLNTAAGNKWAAVSVLAHEIGHHLNGHTLLNTGSQPLLELEADEFSGFVLRKMGASISQAQAAMKLAAGFQQSHTHPAQQDRLVAIAKGWNNATVAPSDLAKYNQPESGTTPASREIAKNALLKNSTALVRRETVAAPVLDSRNILAKIDFPTDRSADYYVTTRFNLVKVSNNELYLMGKMIRTNSTEFPYVLRNNSSRDLFVHQSGKIMTAQKQLAGFMKVKG